MKKLTSIIALLTVLLVAVSGYNGNEKQLALGEKAPEISVVSNDKSFDLDSYKGEYVLLTFWSSSDAQSRIDCNTYTAWAEETPAGTLKHIAINFDNEPALFEEIVRLDNLDSEAQFNVNGLEAERIRTDFGLNEGFGTVLISPDGLITAFNPSKSELSSLV